MPLPLFVVSSGGLEVKGRQKLETQFEELIAELQKRFEQHSVDSGVDELFIISDLDVSQNKLSLDQFQTLFTVLSYPNVCVERFRMFGCPTLDDSVMQVFSDYLRQLAPDCAPLELHLSDCAVTSEGFHSLCGALEETQLYPKANSLSPTIGTPLYLRLENNYITEEHIKEKVDAGVLRHFNKANGKTAPLSGGAKANLVMKGSTYGQKEGSPPAPEEAPPPKQIFDRNNPATKLQQESWNPWMWMMQFGPWGGCHKGGWQKSAMKGIQTSAVKGGMQKGGMTPWPGLMALAGKAKGKGKQLGKSQNPQQSGGQNQWQNQNQNESQSSQNCQSSQWSNAQSWQNQSQGKSDQDQNPSWKAWESKSSTWQDQGGSWKDKSSTEWSSNDSSWGNGSSSSQGQSWQKDSSTGSKQQPQNQDWKRQEGRRGWTSQGSEDRSRTPAPRPKPEAQEKPPPPWEIHYSEEHHLKYFWNSETGESLWEKPEKW